MYIPSNSARERWVWAYSIFCVRLCIVCSFNSDGQYQSLYAWDEQTVRLSRFFFINQSIANERVRRQFFNMTIAKGRTNCKAERDLVLQGFNEQLQILSTSQIEQSNLFKAHLYDIITDFSIYYDEKHTLMSPWSNQLQELEDRHIRIRRSVFIGLYSFWEVSLMDMANTHIPSIVEKALESQKSKNFGASDYLKLIYGGQLPALADLIDNNIREFRNYMVHGSLTEKRESLIKVLLSTHKEFCIEGTCRTYFIRDYEGLFELLTLLSYELDAAEHKIIEIKDINI